MRRVPSRPPSEVGQTSRSGNLTFAIGTSRSNAQRRTEDNLEKVDQPRLMDTGRTEEHHEHGFVKYSWDLG